MKLKIFIVLMLFISAESFSQNDNDVIAKVGDKVITASEFKLRYEFTPQINRQNTAFDIERSKKEFLYTLIAENLFAEEAEKEGYDTTAAMEMNYIPLQKMYARDALYKEVIEKYVKADEKKINDGLWYANNKLFLDYIYSKKKDSIDYAYQELKKSNNFDSAAVVLKNVEYVKDPYEVTYGKMFPAPEKAVYSLKIGEYTKPLESPDGWYIFRLLSEIPVQYKSADQKYSFVKKTVENRVEDSIYNAYYDKFFKDQHVTTDGDLFWSFVDSTQKIVENRKVLDSLKDNEKIVLTTQDLEKLKNSFPKDSLDQPFIKFAENPVSFNDFLDDFIFEGFYTFTTDKRTVANQLNSRVKRQIEMEMLTREAFSQGMESLNEVRASTDMWKKNYLATLFKKNLVQSTKLDDSELSKINKLKNDSLFNEVKVNIVELFTDSLSIVKNALEIANNTDEFKKFAVEHTKRNEYKMNGGESGYVSTASLGEIGKIASTMEVGDVYGPLQVENGYSVFKLIDKKEIALDEKNQKNIQKAKDNMLYNKAVNKLESEAVNLADKFGISVNEKLLKSIQVNNLQMIVFRYMGFGGKIMAFPYTAPFYKWKDKLDQKKKDAL